MTVAADIANRLSDDSQYARGMFATAVFEYGMGVVELLDDWGYRPGANAYIEIEADLDAAEVYTEGDPMPAPIESTYLEAAFAYKAFRGVIRESGHERRSRGPNDEGTRIKDPERKMKRAMAAIVYLIAKTFDDAQTYGIEGQVSAGTYAYGDQSRTTYTKLKAYELNASSAAISTSLLNKWVNLGKDDPYGAQFDYVLGSATQVNKINELMSGKLAAPDISGRPAALTPSDVRIDGAPLLLVPNLTSTILIGLTGVNTGNWGKIWNEANPGRYHVLDLGAANSDTPMNLQISTSLCIAHDNPNKQSKLYGLSTG